MNKMLKKITVMAVTALLPVAMFGCSTADTDLTPEPEENETFTVAIKEIGKRGNVLLDTTFDEMKANDMEIGDLITVFIDETSYDIPIGTSYTDVDTGNMLCRFDLEDNEIGLVINMGSFAETTGVGEKKTIDEDPGYAWDLNVSEISLMLKEKEGYLAEYSARNLTRTNEREDYISLTDEEFANFRAVAATGIKTNWIYRSSTPIEPAIGRNEYAMTAMEEAGILSVINLDDSVDEMKAYDTYPDSYYSRCAVINPEMSYDFTSEEFSEKVRDSLLFIIENDGPYLIHCKEGKDRTGILCAILECFAGATIEEVKTDYMLTYYNYYGIKEGDAAYEIIVNNLLKPLSQLLQTDDIETADLSEKTASYLLSIGLSEEELNLLKEKIAE